MNSWILKGLQTEAGKRLQLQLLMNLAAEATGQKGRFLLGMSSDKALEIFARFTAQHLHVVKQQETLYRKAYRLGDRLRKVLNIQTDEQLTQAIILLYKNISIDMSGKLPGVVVVKNCYFSRCYSSQLCEIASAMDAGIICGLANKGIFQFSERITEGCKQCKATLTI